MEDEEVRWTARRARRHEKVGETESGRAIFGDIEVLPRREEADDDG